MKIKEIIKKYGLPVKINPFSKKDISYETYVITAYDGECYKTEDPEEWIEILDDEEFNVIQQMIVEKIIEGKVTQFIDFQTGKLVSQIFEENTAGYRHFIDDRSISDLDLTDEEWNKIMEFNIPVELVQPV